MTDQTLNINEEQYYESKFDEPEEIICPECGQPAVEKNGHCLTCHECGWSACVM
jgi:ribosomal protein L37AE/L43A